MSLKCKIILESETLPTFSIAHKLDHLKPFLASILALMGIGSFYYLVFFTLTHAVSLKGLFDIRKISLVFLSAGTFAG